MEAQCHLSEEAWAVLEATGGLLPDDHYDDTDEDLLYGEDGDGPYFISF